ncbi:hypothetical protein GJW-30_1_03687 [Variibacter gotjawalensis]|uniref:Uncharacterized protein n=1 Tax=Variibacter gotjawalensis TaxID=1333996 RepID=A0A0S3PZ17_9BRAD|nr:hypothetical protein [Variibacter gotjawalensis]NIK46968.1 hypothetical protein [Variibacter gotjawalensis]RZS48872.1 hypothetical protein EV661_1294 [Variibacter gotjawalensis]BAT61131.1 hypothetical protein GJW-30_1_03687 [Variibacter gotjawalensis]
MFARPQVDLELQRIKAPSWATPGATVYALMPSLATLVGWLGFGEPAIRLEPAKARPAFDAHAFFGGNTVH